LYRIFKKNRSVYGIQRAQPFEKEKFLARQSRARNGTSISRVLSRAAIYLGRTSQYGSSNQPGNPNDAGRISFPI
jgi:hypothetical protein